MKNRFDFICGSFWGDKLKWGYFLFFFKNQSVRFKRYVWTRIFSHFLSIEMYKSMKLGLPIVFESLITLKFG